MNTAQTKARTWTLTAITSALALSAYVHLPGLLNARPLDDDETYLTSIGKMLRAGDVLYRDVIDRKPPLVMWAYQLMVPNSWDLRPIRLVAALLIAMNGLVLHAIATRIGMSSTGARAAGAFAIIGSALFGFADAHAANFEIWGLAAASISVLITLRVPSRSSSAARFGELLAGGAMAGIATNCKQPYIFTLIVIAFALPRLRRMLHTAIAATGFIAMTCSIAALSGWSGYWKWVWFENGDYIHIGFVTLVTLAIRQCTVFAVVQWPLSTSAFQCMRTTSPKLKECDSAARRLGVIWFSASLIGVASGLRFFGHYFQQVVPALALLAGLALHNQRRKAQRRILAAASFVPLLWMLAWVPGFAGLDAAPRQLAQGIAARTTPDDRVLIWGRLPDAAVQAHRTPAGRFVHQAYLTGSWASVDGVDDPAHTEPYAQRWNDYIDGLVNSPPALIVDASAIVDEWHQYPIHRLPLQRLINACYRTTAKIDDLNTYEWTGTSCADAVDPRDGL